MAAVTVRALKAGEVYGHAQVTVELTDLNGTAVTGYAEGVLVAPLTQPAGADGTLVLDLVPNVDIAPANTYYTVTIGGRSALIEVGSGGGQIEDLLVSSPADLGSGATLASLVDVDVAGVADGDALVYDAGADEWVPGTGGGGGGSDDQTAAEVPFTPSGGLASTNVQTALVELDTEKQPKATVLTNTTASFTTAQETKLAGIEALADVTHAGNVAAAGALMAAGLGSVTQAWAAKLDVLAALTWAADKGLYCTSAGAAATFDLTAAGRALLDDADAPAQLTTLGLSAFFQTLVGAANAAALRSLLGLGTAALVDTGTGAGNAILGNDARLTDSRAPSGAAGGVLAGTFPNPSFASDMATQAELDAKVEDALVDGVTTKAPSQNVVVDQLALKAPLASPALTGSPTAPTQSAADNSTKLATTAYADAKVADAINDSTTGVAPSQNAVFDALALKAALASPALTGTPTAPTAAQGTNTTQLATTAYVQTEAGLLIPKSLVDAKGDLLVGTADNTVARLPVGTNTHVLTADSSQSAGVKWAAVSGGSDRVEPPFTFQPLQFQTNSSVSTNRAHYLRIGNNGGVFTITKLAVWIGTSSGNICLSVLRGSNAASGPTSRIATSGSVASPGTGYQEISLGGSVAVDPTTDWFGVSADNNTVQFGRVGAPGATNAFGTGLSYYQDTAHPIPSTPTPVVGWLAGFIIMGVA